MHNQTQLPTTTATKDYKTTGTTIYYLIATAFFSLLFIFYLSSSHSSPSPPYLSSDPSLFHNRLNLNISSSPSPPSIAYLISGSSGDSGRILRLLLAIYHPRNQYLLHLDLSATKAERDSLALSIQSIPIFKAVQNVNVINKADFADPKGCSSISATLHGASLLLRLSANWDWFINLSAADYPLITQDDLLHILSYLPKDLNFVNHTSYIGWRESRRLKPIIVDPGLYLLQKTTMFYSSQKRELPDAYQLFTGSAAGILSRKLIEFCIIGTDNFPRTLLMYLSNTPSSLSVYFPTLVCNSRKFSRTTVNHNLQYSAFNTRQEPRHLNSSDFIDLINSGAAFASPFLPDDPVLDSIDREILSRMPAKPAPGGWCIGESGHDPCNHWCNAEVLRPGSGAKRLENLFIDLLSNGTFRSHQCVSE